MHSLPVEVIPEVACQIWWWLGVDMVEIKCMANGVHHCTMTKINMHLFE